MMKITASKRESSPRLCGPRKQSRSLKERALARAASAPSPKASRRPVKEVELPRRPLRHPQGAFERRLKKELS